MGSCFHTSGTVFPKIPDTQATATSLKDEWDIGRHLATLHPKHSAQITTRALQRPLFVATR